MKRSLIFCAIALVAVAANSALAAVNVQLNLRYDNPADEAAGGTWDLLVLSDGGGIAGVSVLVDNVTGAAAAGTTGYGVFETQIVGTVAEIVAGHDDAGLAGGASDIGLGVGTTGAVADDLFAGNSPTWDNSALIASGAFGATRPSFLATSGSLAAGANELSGGAAVATTMGTMSVRGDGVATDGLLGGDRDRNGSVSLGLDIVPMLGNLGNPGGWDDGDFDGSGDVSLGLDIVPILGNLGLSATPPAVSAAVSSVPEPTSLVLAGSIALAVVGMRRRR